MNKIKGVIPCDEANHVCDKTQYKEASLWEKIMLNIHLIYCRACRKYTKLNTNLTKAIENSHVKCLDQQCKKNMKKTIDKAIKEQSY